MTVLSSLFSSERKSVTRQAWMHPGQIKLRDGEIEQDPKIRRIKSAIANGTYETPERLDAAVDNLLAEIDG